MVSSLSACLRDDPVNISDGDGPEESTGYKLGSREEFDTKTDGQSSLCLNEAGDGLLLANDNGFIYEYDLEGKLTDSHEIKGDWEGITRASDGTIYLCEERTREVYRLSADHNSVTLFSKGLNETQESGYAENQGYEGIAAGPGVLYIANQSGPKRVYTCNVSTKEWGKAFDFPAASSLSDIFYDADDNTLWITDAKTRKLTQFKTDGTQLQTIDISFVNKPEGFCKDSGRKLFWFVCDKTNILYKVSYQQ